MTDDYTLEWDADGGARLGGQLTFATCPALFRELERHGVDAPVDGAVDLAGVEKVDSAGLALLLEWQARQRRGGRLLTLQHAPDGLVSLAQLADALELLNLSGREVAGP
jgi:phospholipid transport system transporter-binding protein